MGDGRDPGPDADDGVDGEHVDVVALVLGQVDAQRRAELTSHLLTCSTCLREHNEMAATVSDLLSAVPAIQPPLGFDERVLGSLGIGRARRSSPHPRTWLVAAAAGLIVVLAGIAWWTTDNDETVAVGDVSPLELVDGGDDVGTVSIGNVDGETVMVVALVAAPDGVSYRCRTTFADGTTTESEPWPAGNGAWIVALPASASVKIDTVEIVVAGTDDVWSTASFDDGGT